MQRTQFWLRRASRVVALIVLVSGSAARARGQESASLRMSAEAGAGAQASPGARSRSTSEGFFVGGGIEGNGLLSTDGGFNSETESGRGFGLVAGYGFNRRVSLYAALSAARMDSLDFVGTYGLGHFDLGTRIHFRSGVGRVVPFVQAGLAGRAISADLYSGSRRYNVSASGAGLSFGGGLNAHFNPALAFSGGVTWMVGNFSTYEVNNVQVPGDTSSATSARVHVGLVWFPRGNRP